jgi:site-specific DNA-methyltransferase (adenine-specific)
VAERKPTSTSNFGVSRRESHDSSEFYARFTPPEISDDKEISTEKEIDDIFVGSSASMPDVKDNSVALVVTSPPYFAGKEYEEALGQGGIPSTYLDYLGMLRDVFRECYRTLEPGGRMAINVANLGRKPYRSLAADVIDILQRDLRMLLRGEIVWQKARGSSGSCAWGSFQKPANPVLRDVTERVIIASKGRFDRAISPHDREKRGLPSYASLSADDFMELTLDLWDIPPESAVRVNHPAPFPVDLPLRLIHLYTYYDDLVLDPFMGSGTTAIAAVRTGRHYVGYDTDPEYVQRAKERVRAEVERRSRDASRQPIAFRVPAIRTEPDDGLDFQARATREGKAAKEVAQALLEQAGFHDIKRDVKVAAGVTVNFSALDEVNGSWFFDVSGGFTSHRPGLKRTDTLWKALGKAAVLHEKEPHVPLVLLTTDRPPRNSAGSAALDAVMGPEKPIHAVIEMLNDADRQLLSVFAREGRNRPE